jgi:anaerobic ribonucleoside-triphosphate reductase activating protein
MTLTNNANLRIGKYLISTNVNGPGRRFVIWFQGCRFHCQGCFNPEFWDKSGGTIMTVEEIIAQIRACNDIEGVTFSGGEPLLQAQALIPLARWIKANGLSLFCYTGYRYEEISEIPYAQEALQFVDILIDGRFMETEKPYCYGVEA